MAFATVARALRGAITALTTVLVLVALLLVCSGFTDPVRLAAWAFTLAENQLRPEPAGAGPDPRLTPGAIASTNAAEICAPGYARAHRVWHAKAFTLQRYGISPDRARDFEDDDLVPICIGGDNASPLNHWPEPWDQAQRKDSLEHWACRAACEGLLTLENAQQLFLSGRWRTLIGDPDGVVAR
jgi:hypothetical protein